MTSEGFDFLREVHSLFFFNERTPGKMIRRSCNFLLRGFDRRFLPLRTLSIPSFAYVEPTNKCNLKCQMCHRSFLPLSSIGEMTFEEFRRMVDPTLVYMDHIWLQGLGEPFLCKDIFRMIKYLKRRNIFVSTVTNATLLDNGLCKKVVSSGLDDISISIDGATAETFEKIRVGADFERVTANVHRLTSAVRAGAYKHPLVNVATVATMENVHELPDLVVLVHKLGVHRLWVQDVQFQHLEVGHAKKEKSLRALAKEDQAESVDIQRYLRSAYKLAKKHHVDLLTYGEKSVFDRLYVATQREKCLMPWAGIYVTWDGGVYPCCIPSDYACGNLLNESLTRIWNNKKYRAFRQRLKSNRIPSQCVSCSFL